VDIHAGLLLIAYRAEKALPIFDSIFRDEEREWLLEWFSTEMHHYGPAAVPTFLALVQDKKVYDYGRAEAADVLTEIANQYPEVRETILNALRALLLPMDQGGKLVQPAGSEIEDIWTWVALALRKLKDEESRSHIVALYQADLIDGFILGSLTDYLEAWDEEPSYPPRRFDLLGIYEWLHDQVRREEESLARYEASKAAEQASRPLRLPQLPSSPLARPVAINTSTIRPATVSQPKIGRNDPCPCGSGKKYKKCHGDPAAQRR
jgi:hypothetical protein